MATGVVQLGSDLIRKKWMREGLIQAASKSFWSPLTGGSRKSIVFQKNDEKASDGHTVVFDFDGNLSGKAVKGKDTAFGKGEQKKKFSEKVTVERYRLVADNGDSFDAVNIGDLSISQHSDSRTKLGDLFVRFKDQSIFDSAQGLLTTNDSGIQAPSHVFDLGTTFTFNTLVDLETSVKTSQGFSTGGLRRPPEPYMTADGEPVWILLIDSAMASVLRQDVAGYQTIVRSGDVRGNANRNIKGVIGRMGSFLIVVADQFFGETSGSQLGWGLNDSEIEMCGLRQYSGASAATSAWTGQAGFDYNSATLHSRGLILGAGGLQTAFGKMPDYKFQESQDFGIKSESAVEFWMESRKTNLKAENAAYKAAKVSDLDFGVLAVDLQVS